MGLKFVEVWIEDVGIGGGSGMVVGGKVLYYVKILVDLFVVED